MSDHGNADALSRRPLKGTSALSGGTLALPVECWLSGPGGVYPLADGFGSSELVDFGSVLTTIIGMTFLLVAMIAP